jgi:hypothetical protein
VVPAEARSSIPERDRKAVIEAIRLIGPPKLERAAPLPPPAAPSSLTPGEAAVLLRMTAAEQLAVASGHEQRKDPPGVAPVHGVTRASLNANGTMLRIECKCGTPIGINAAHLSDPRTLGRILAAGISSVP